MVGRVRSRVLIATVFVIVLVCCGWIGAVAQQNHRTLAQWTELGDHGDHAAMAHLCRVYFDGRNGTFEPAKTAVWCRRSAAAGNARAMHRLALLALAGVGTPKDLTAATTLCSAAHQRDGSVSSGFCLAAVYAERRNTGQPLYLAVPSATSPPNNKSAAKMTKWRDQANRDETTALSKLCSAYFDALDGAFDPVATAEWCRRAAEYGDARAEERIGLMHLWGVGMERSLHQAEALCKAAHARNSAVSEAFCVAAARQQYDEAAEQESPSAVVYPTPWPGVRSPVTPDPRVLTRVLGPDRVLESVHVTPSGLHYNCRTLTRWARYGPPIGAEAFGRQVAKLTKQDYADLNAAASACAADIAPYDKNGSERALLSKFQRQLVALEMRQRSLIASIASRKAEQLQQIHEDQSLNRRVLILTASLSEEQQRCIAEIDKAWLNRDYSPSASLLEIRSATTSEVNGNMVVSGDAAIINTAMNMYPTAQAYSCIFASHSPKIVAESLGPSAALPSSTSTGHSESVGKVP